MLAQRVGSHSLGSHIILFNHRGDRQPVSRCPVPAQLWLGIQSEQRGVLKGQQLAASLTDSLGSHLPVLSEPGHTKIEVKGQYRHEPLRIHVVDLSSFEELLSGDRELSALIEVAGDQVLEHHHDKV